MLSRIVQVLALSMLLIVCMTVVVVVGDETSIPWYKTNDVSTPTNLAQSETQNTVPTINYIMEFFMPTLAEASREPMDECLDHGHNLIYCLWQEVHCRFLTNCEGDYPW